MKKSQAREKKEETVKKLAEKMLSSKSMVLADYQGLNVATFQLVKNKLEEDEAEFTVAKNTLIDLDILWIDGEKVVGKSFLPSIEKSKEIVTVESPKSADKVIEIPAKK